MVRLCREWTTLLWRRKQKLMWGYSILGIGRVTHWNSYFHLQYSKNLLIYLAACKGWIHYFEEKMAIIDESVFNSGKRQSYKLKFTVFIYYKNYLIYLIMLRDIGNYHCDNIIISCFPPKTGNYCWECIQFWEMVVLQTYYS